MVVARTVTVPRTRWPSLGASRVIAGFATCALRGVLSREWPALSSTTALYCICVPGSASQTSWKTR